MARLCGLILIALVLFAPSLAAAASFTFAPPPTLSADEPIVRVDQGCGPGWWRGPWGHCRDTPYTGNLPGGGYGTNVGESYWNGGNYGGNGCPPGWWRGPWGHCRNTPYHGRLPDGSWQ
jgi:hypothetical protein